MTTGKHLVIRQRETMAARGINRAIVKTQHFQLLRRAGQCEHYAERGTSSPENVTGSIQSVSFISLRPQRPVRKHSRMVAPILNTYGD